MRPVRPFIPCLLLFAGLAVLAGCGPTLESQWRDREITIDGRDVEWEGTRVALADGWVGMGLMNDQEFMYLTVSLMDRATQAQVMRQGLIIWFDPKGGKRKEFGVQYPLGMRQMAMAGEGAGPQGIGMGGMDRGRMGGRRRDRTPRPEQLQAMFEQLARVPEMEVLGRGNRRDRLGFGESEDIQLRLGYEGGRLVYELRVPFATNPYGIGADAKPTIGVGFEMPELDMAALRQGMGGRGGMPGGGMSGGMDEGFGGGMDGGMRGGRMRGMGGGSVPEPLKLWLKVRRALPSGSPSPR